jgi:hypothetical protein
MAENIDRESVGHRGKVKRGGERPESLSQMASANSPKKRKVLPNSVGRKKVI